MQMGETEVKIERYSLDSISTKWESWVQASPEGTPFASNAFLNAYQNFLGLMVDIWVVERGGEWVAAIPILYYNLWGRRTNFGIPLVPHLPIMYDPGLFASSYPSSNTTLYLKLTRLLNKAVAAHYGSICFTLLPGVLDVRPWLWDGWKVRPNYTYILDLESQPRYAHAVRKQVRKAQESGLVLDEGWDLDVHCSLLDGTRKRQGVWIGLAEEPFRKIAECLRQEGLAWMATARSASGEPLASRLELTLPAGRVAYDWTAGSNPDRQNLGGSSWLMTKIFEQLGERGVVKWNLCGASFETIARFKADFGGELQLYFSAKSPRDLLNTVYEDGRQAGSAILRACGWRR